MTNNDGLLVNYIALERKLTYVQSEKYVYVQVDHWKSKLDNGERIELDKIGNLFLDSEKNIQFDQDRFTNLLLESYGLDKIHFIGAEELKIVLSRESEPEVFEEIKTNLTFDSSSSIEQIEETKDGSKEAPIVSIKPSRRPVLLKFAAAAVLVPIAFYSYWIPMKTNVLSSGIISLQDFDPSYKSTEGKYDKVGLKEKTETTPEIKTIEERIEGLPSQVDVYYYKFDDDLYIPVSLNKKNIAVQEKATPISTPEKVEPSKSISEGGQKSLGHLIVGSFSSEENALALVNTLNNSGFSALAMPLTTGMWRVSAGQSYSNQQLQDLKEKNFRNSIGRLVVKVSKGLYDS